MHNRLYFFIAASVFAIVACFFSGYQLMSTAHAQVATPMTGYAWSENIGWLSLNCATGNPSGGSICASNNYSVSINADLTVTGYAWSDNIGWVKFGGLSGFPGGVSFNNNATIQANTLTGWVRACAGTVNNDCASATRTDGWDGWIYLGSTGYGDGVLINGTGTMSGFAWGSTVVGWLDFQYAQAVPACVATPNYQCVSGNTISRYTNASCVVTDTSCPFGCSGATGQCYAAPQPASGCLSIGVLSPCKKTFTATAGSKVTLFWQISNATSCVVSGTNGDGGPSATGWNVTSQTAGVETSELSGKHIFTLSCVGNDSSIFTDTVEVNMRPKIIEQ